MPAEDPIIPYDIISSKDPMCSSLWIFGYGSLIWKQNFKYSRKRIGYVNGYVRRFWQGCVNHRGVPDSPGRVATLVEDCQGTTWGIAFLLEGEAQISEALGLLNTRETVLGDYALHSLDFHPQDGGKQFTSYTYIAGPNNRHYLGPAPSGVIARSIAEGNGRSGSNTEYLFKLADFMRDFLPHIEDDHLNELAQETKKIINGKES